MVGRFASTWGNTGPTFLKLEGITTIKPTITGITKLDEVGKRARKSDSQ
jgi:hypothetical protein